ncbi:MAG: CcmD family protein [Flavobacteriales bacterium]|nr:CcmD family protein [Flavobacteriales bacterium]
MRTQALFLAIILSSVLSAQDSQMVEFMYSSGKINVVIGVVLTILVILFIYLIRLDRRIKRLERGED